MKTVNFLYSSVYVGRVANALACNAVGDGFAPTFNDISEIYFSNRSRFRRSVTCNDLCDITGNTVTCDVSGVHC